MRQQSREGQVAENAAWTGASKYLCWSAAILGTALVVSACTTNASVEPTMTAAQIRSELIDRDLGYSGAFSGSIIYNSNGTLNYVANGGSFTGRWRLDGDRMCTVLSSDIRGGRQSCFSWFDAGNGQYRTSLGYTAWRK